MIPEMLNDYLLPLVGVAGGVVATAMPYVTAIIKIASGTRKAVAGRTVFDDIVKAQIKVQLGWFFDKCEGWGRKGSWFLRRILGKRYGELSEDIIEFIFGEAVKRLFDGASKDDKNGT